jgi:diguanylate cyclase (GGDEF)-like protein
MNYELVEFLKNVSIFSMLTIDEMNKFIDYLKVIEIEHDKTLFKEGDIGKELYIVKSGKIILHINLPNGKTRELTQFITGDFFGEMSIFENATRSATCHCKEDSVLLSLHADSFFKVVNNNPEIATKIMYKMLNITTARLQNVSEFLSDIIQWGDTARKRAITDELTGVFNRRFLDDAIEEYFGASKKNMKPMALIMIDMDHFRDINECYSQKIGDMAICSVVRVFNKYLRERDIVARYGGDEFTIVMPETDVEEVKRISRNIQADVGRLDILKKLNGKIKKLTLSQGVSVYPHDGDDVKTVWNKADQSLYKAKEEGRNRIIYSFETDNIPRSPKKEFKDIKEQNLIIRNIIDAIDRNNSFLVAGHVNPDEDCISSMIAFALLLKKLNKEVVIFFDDKRHNNFKYLLNICKYNSISIISKNVNIKNITALVICDTPKTAMVEPSPEIKSLLKNRNIRKIEIDHHLASDSEYIGDHGYCMVTEANSSSELVGKIILKLNKMKSMNSKYEYNDLLTRNIVLAIITGIIGDTRMGQFIKSEKLKRSYVYFINLFNDILKKKTTKKTNFSTKEQIFQEIIKLSSDEEKCFHRVIMMKKFTKHVGYIIIKQDEMKELLNDFENDTIVSVVRTVADALAEDSKKISIVAYYDDPKTSDLVQFKVRRSQKYKGFDLREILDFFSIKNGGGHEGAIAFRISKEAIFDIDEYVKKLISGIEKKFILNK